jgi:hypothetical protein
MSIESVIAGSGVWRSIDPERPDAKVIVSRAEGVVASLSAVVIAARRLPAPLSLRVVTALLSVEDR